MKIRGLIFDLNGTLIDINTDENCDEIYRTISNFLLYQGIYLDRDSVRDLYFRKMKEQRRASTEAHPEFDVVAIFEDILAQYANTLDRLMPVAKREQASLAHAEIYNRPPIQTAARRGEQLPLILAELYRATSLYRLQLYPGVKEVLDELRPRYRLAALSDAQSPWALPELHAVGLGDYFDPVVVSGDLGFRKPDTRIFMQALNGMELEKDEVLFVGNDMYRDVFGAQQVGLKTVFFRSNQGDQQREGVEPDYIIYNFPELLQAIKFFENVME